MYMNIYVNIYIHKYVRRCRCLTCDFTMSLMPTVRLPLAVLEYGPLGFYIAQNGYPKARM